MAEELPARGSWTDFQYQVSFLLRNSLKSNHRVVGYPNNIHHTAAHKAISGQNGCYCCLKALYTAWKDLNNVLLSNLHSTSQN